MLGTVWIDRPVDTQGRAPCFHVLLSARMEARPCSFLSRLCDAA